MYATGQCVRIKHVKRAREVIGDVVRHVDQCRNGAQSDRPQTVLKPLRARAILDTLDVTADEHRASIPGLGVKAQIDTDGAIEGAGHDIDPVRFQRAQPGSGQVPGDPADTEAILTVRRNGNLDHGIIEAQHACKRLSQRCVFGKFDNAFVLIREAHLPFRTQHAPALDPADLRRLELHAIAGNGRPHRRVNALHSGVSVWRPAHHIECLAARIDRTNLQTVGVWMRPRFHDVGDCECVQPRRLVHDLFDFQTDRGQGLG